MHHLLILKSLSDIPWSRSRDLDPGLGEESARRQHKGDVDSGMDRVEDGFLDGMRRRHVVRDARGGDELRSLPWAATNNNRQLREHIVLYRMAYLPDAQKFDQDVARETRGEHMRNDEDVRRQCRFQHDGV